MNRNESTKLGATTSLGSHGVRAGAGSDMGVSVGPARRPRAAPVPSYRVLAALAMRSIACAELILSSFQN